MKIALCGFPLSGKRTLALALVARAREPSINPTVQRVGYDRLLTYSLHSAECDGAKLVTASGSLWDVVEANRAVFGGADLIVCVDKSVPVLDEDFFHSRKEHWDKTRQAAIDCGVEPGRKPWLFVRNMCGKDDPAVVLDSLVPPYIPRYTANLEEGWGVERVCDAILAEAGITPGRGSDGS